MLGLDHAMAVFVPYLVAKLRSSATGLQFPAGDAGSYLLQRLHAEVKRRVEELLVSKGTLTAMTESPRRSVPGSGGRYGAN